MLAAVNTLGANQREYTEQLRLLVDGQRQLADGQRDTNARVRSIGENLAEMRVLLAARPLAPDHGGGRALMVMTQRSAT